MNVCPCGSAKLFAACCAPYHSGAPAPTAEALMRSRYTAYATGNIDYIERTCAGPAAKMFKRQDAEIWSKSSEWLGLEITGRERGLEGDETGTVSFTFRFRQNGQTIAAGETSIFEKVDGHWMYCDRKDDNAKPSKPGRNDPCPCGSGKKYKKCCGA